MAMNIHAQVFQYLFFIIWGSISKSGIPGSYGNSMFNFLMIR